jgi:hypothetical protein
MRGSKCVGCTVLRPLGVHWDQGKAPTAWPRTCPNKSYILLPIHLDIKADAVKEGRGGSDKGRMAEDDEVTRR